MDNKPAETTTIMFARILSAYLLITGLGFLFSDDFFNRMISQSNSDPILINLSGMVHFFIGMSILVTHFLWRNILESIVTLLGLMFTLKGALLIAIPEWTLQMGNNSAQETSFMAAGFIFIGCLSGYLAYFKNNIEK